MVGACLTNLLYCKYCYHSIVKWLLSQEICDLDNLGSLCFFTVLVKQAAEAIQDYEELLDMSTAKVRKLVEILKSYLPKVESICW